MLLKAALLLCLFLQQKASVQIDWSICASITAVFLQGRTKVDEHLITKGVYLLLKQNFTCCLGPDVPVPAYTNKRTRD